MEPKEFQKDFGSTWRASRLSFRVAFSQVSGCFKVPWLVVLGYLPVQVLGGAGDLVGSYMQDLKRVASDVQPGPKLLTTSPAPSSRAKAKEDMDFGLLRSLMIWWLALKGCAYSTTWQPGLSETSSNEHQTRRILRPRP